MNEYVISLLDGKKIDFAADGISSIIQNVRTILSTKRGTCPLYRDFGVDWSFVDKPVNMIPPMVRSLIREQIERYEPRARVESVTFEQDPVDPGVIYPKVRLTILGL